MTCEIKCHLFISFHVLSEILSASFELYLALRDPKQKSSRCDFICTRADLKNHLHLKSLTDQNIMTNVKIICKILEEEKIHSERKGK